MKIEIRRSRSPIGAVLENLFSKYAVPFLPLLVAFLMCHHPVAFAESGRIVARCVPAPGQSGVVSIPSELGRLLLNDVYYRDNWGGDMIGEMPKTNPNTLYQAKAYDIDRNGRIELLIRTRPEGPFELSRNNPVWIAEETKRGFKLLLHATATYNGGPIALNSSTNGYADVCVINTLSALVREVTIFVFDGVKYRPRTCYDLYDETDPEAGDPPPRRHYHPCD